MDGSTYRSSVLIWHISHNMKNIVYGVRQNALNDYFPNLTVYKCTVQAMCAVIVFLINILVLVSVLTFLFDMDF